MQQTKTGFNWGWLIFVMGFCPLTVTAGSMEDEHHQSSFSWVASMSGGPIWLDHGKRQTLTLEPDIVKTYTVHKKSQVNGEGEFFVGIERTANPHLDWQLGVALAATGNALIQGNIWDDGFAIFDNYTYQYKISHAHVAAKGKLISYLWSLANPYVSGSLGVAWNNAHEFESRPTIFPAVETPEFTSKTKSSFTYTVGVGLQRPLTQHITGGIGYEFADWGKSQLGRAREQTQGTGLSLNHFYTNALMVNLTYIS